MHLLLIEDDEALGDVVRRGLESYGYRVEWVRDGAEAYDIASAGAFDALILDLMLPNLDGLTLLRGLREAGIRTPVLCLTARSGVRDRVAGLDAGADDYVVKPFAFEELLARLRALLRRPQDLFVPEALVFGALRLEPAERQVTVEGRALDVPPREFDVLEYLLRHAGRVLSRDAILERVWGPGEAPRANVVDATVSRLRRRLRGSGWTGQIAAVPGHGYRIATADQRPTP
ncbi:MAG TPA: response regulator transcription factor [bacterium]|nr:response regulator transcription factor [bacterium]